MRMEKYTQQWFSVNESLLTGRPYAVFKSEKTEICFFSGTLVASGLAVWVTKIGSNTEVGKLGTSLQSKKHLHHYKFRFKNL
jgi:Ca2+-transporting ATPase